MKVILNLLVALLGFLAAQVQAVDCRFEHMDSNEFSIPVIGPGLSTAGEDTPVGKVLYTWRYVVPIQNQFKTNILTCSADLSERYNFNIGYDLKVIATPSGAATSSGGKDIFPTNVDGVGAVFYITSPIFSATAPSYWTQFPASDETSFLAAGGTYTLSVSSFSQIIVELIKTGPITAGTQQVLGSSFPTFQFTLRSASIPASYTDAVVSFTGATTLYTKTCQLASSNIDVDLGKHDIKSFDGIGATSAWQNFDITLKDCPPFYGYGNYSVSYTGKVTGSSSTNSVALSFKSVNGVTDSNPGIANLESGADTATGVGIELSRRNVSGSIPLDGTDGFELDKLTTDDNATYVIPLKARYVQTESSVTAGIANGAVVFTIVYQ